MIFVECKPDYTLVCKLRPDMAAKVEHSSDKAGVLNRLIRRSGYRNYENSIGMIDEDPRSLQPKVIRDFDLENELANSKIRVLHYRFLNNHVLVLCPRLEEWIIDACTESGVNILDYGLPNNGEKLHSIINVNLENFKNLVDTLIIESNRVKDLQRCLMRE